MSTTSVYRSRPIKRTRRTQAAMHDLRRALYALVEQHQPVTVRQTFYLAVSAGLINKSEKEYKHTVMRLLTEMRREQVLPYGWIADYTRWMRKPHSYNNLDDALQATARLYRRNLWHTQEAYVEIWLEKDALAGVVMDVTAQWDVPLMVTRGYPSLSFLYEAAEYIRALDKAVHLYYFGDHDPSGHDIPRKVEADLRAFLPPHTLTFTRVAVQPWQIDAWQLPTRPTKQSDSRSKVFVGDSVEVDAIPPSQLRQLVRECIEPHVDEHALYLTSVAEEQERKILQMLDVGTLVRLQQDAGVH
jgi:hypothetical protein